MREDMNNDDTVFPVTLVVKESTIKLSPLMIPNDHIVLDANSKQHIQSDDVVIGIDRNRNINSVSPTVTKTSSTKKRMAKNITGRYNTTTSLITKQNKRRYKDSCSEDDQTVQSCSIIKPSLAIDLYDNCSSNECNVRVRSVSNNKYSKGGNETTSIHDATAIEPSSNSQNEIVAYCASNHTTNNTKSGKIKSPSAVTVSTTTDGSSCSSSSNNSSSGVRGMLIDEPKPYDVLCGKDKTYGMHKGNVLFREKIIESLQLYKSSSKSGRMVVTKQIVTTLQKMYGTRFLRPVRRKEQQNDHQQNPVFVGKDGTTNNHSSGSSCSKSDRCENHQLENEGSQPCKVLSQHETIAAQLLLFDNSTNQQRQQKHNPNVGNNINTSNITNTNNSTTFEFRTNTNIPSTSTCSNNRNASSNSTRAIKKGTSDGNKCNNSNCNISDWYWEEVSDQLARDKTSHALRFALKKGSTCCVRDEETGNVENRTTKQTISNKCDSDDNNKLRNKTTTENNAIIKTRSLQSVEETVSLQEHVPSSKLSSSSSSLSTVASKKRKNYRNRLLTEYNNNTVVNDHYNNICYDNADDTTNTMMGTAISALMQLSSSLSKSTPSKTTTTNVSATTAAVADTSTTSVVSMSSSPSPLCLSSSLSSSSPSLSP